MFAGLVVIHCAVAFRLAVGFHLAPDGHLRLQFAHPRLDLARIDGCPHILGPVIVNRVRIVVVKEEVGVIGFFAAPHISDGSSIERFASRQREDSEGLPAAVLDLVLHARGHGCLHDLLHFHALRRGNHSHPLGKHHLPARVRIVRHYVSVLLPHRGALQAQRVLKASGKELPHYRQLVQAQRLPRVGLGNHAGIPPALPYGKEIDAANGQRNQRNDERFLPVFHAVLPQLNGAEAVATNVVMLCAGSE